MNKIIHQIALLYELSLTTVRHDNPLDVAQKFLNKFLSRKGLNYGAIWIIKKSANGKIYFDPLHTVPQTSSSVKTDEGRFHDLFKNEDLAFNSKSIFGEIPYRGTFAYFKLSDYGVLELHSTLIPENISSESLNPFVEVFEQLALSLKSGFAFQKLQKEIGQRKVAERSLRTNEKKYQNILQNIRLGLLEVDNEELIQYANHAFCDITGYSLQELQGNKASEILFSYKDQEYKSTVQEETNTRKEGISSVYELRIRNKNGQPIWMIVSGAPNYNDQGEKIGSIGIHMDITKQKELVAENEFSEFRLKKILDLSLDAFVTIDQSSRIIEWNPQAEKIFGWSREEALGKLLWETIIPGKHVKDHKQGMTKYKKHKTGAILNKRIEITATHKTGRELPVELTVFPIEFENRHFFSAFIRDISEEKRSKQNLERTLQQQKELNEMQSQFVSMTSHELRTPLTAIISNLELLNYHMEDGDQLDRDKLKKNVARIENNTDRLNSLIANILLVSQLESKKVPFRPEPTNLTEFVLNKIIPHFEEAHRPRHVQLKEYGKRKDVEIDRKLFRHVLNNLVDNALKYSPDSDDPVIELHYLGDQIKIRIVDYGIGIPESEQDKLFESFFRASNVGNMQGTGLGLSIVRQFVNMHRGEIKLDSSFKKGTAFTILLK